MMKSRFIGTYVSCASALVVGGIMVAGCGSLAANRKAAVEVRSTNIGSAFLIVSPNNGTANDSMACNNSSTGFDCTRAFGFDSTQITFKTNSLASTQPYNVFIRNTSASTIRITLNLYMDDDLQDSGGYDIVAGDTVRIGEVRRTTARALNL